MYHIATAVPFPGLRPFLERDQEFFTGQDEQIEALYRRLDRNRFVTVMGASGCGKSSLVRAGLVPLLKPSRAGDSEMWTVVVTRPGSDPVGNLVRKLASPKQPFGGEAAPIDRRLRRSELGLIEVARDAGLDSRKRVIVIVDQFEELFRYRRKNLDGKALDDSAFFIKLLLESSNRPDSPFYVVTTMRSEYLEDCSIFYGLAEAVNRGVFLLPRMSHVQCEQAILEPLQLLDVPISTALVQRLLAETEDRQDGLPLMQHALRLIWSRWHSQGRHERIAEPHFEITGGDARLPMVNRNLDDHLDQIYSALPNAQQSVARIVFTLLSEWDEKGNETRRTAIVQDVMDVSGADLQTVCEAIGAFWNEDRGRTFLTAPDLEDGSAALLRPEDAIDLSHECLMRQWRQLRSWMKEERENASHFRRLWDFCEKEGTEGLSSGPPLATLLDWKERFQPQPAWARRYSIVSDPAASRRQRNLATALDFLERSRKTERWRKLRRRLTEAFSVVSVLLFMLYWAIQSDKEAARRLKEARDAQEAGRLEAQLRQAAGENEKKARAAADMADQKAAEAQRNLERTRKLESELSARLKESQRQAEELRAARDELRRRIADRDRANQALQENQKELERINEELNKQSTAREVLAGDLKRQLGETQLARSEANRANAIERALRLAREASSIADRHLAFKLLEEGFRNVRAIPAPGPGSQGAAESLLDALKTRLQESAVRREAQFNQWFNRELAASAYLDDGRLVGLEDHTDDFQIRNPVHYPPVGRTSDGNAYPLSMGNFFNRVVGKMLRNTARVTKAAALSSSGAEAIYGTANGHSFFYDARDEVSVRWRPLLVAHSTVSFLAFDRLGKYIVADGSRGSFFITNAQSGKQYKESLAGAEPPAHMAVAGCSDGMWVFAGDPSPAPHQSFWGSLPVGSVFRYTCGEAPTIHRQTVQPVILTSQDPPTSGSIEALTVSPSGLPAVAYTWGIAARCVWAPQSAMIANGTYFAPIRERIMCYGSPVTSLSFEPELGEALLAVLTQDGTVSILDVRNRKEVLRLDHIAAGQATARFDQPGVLTLMERSGRVRAIDVRRSISDGNAGSLAGALNAVRNTASRRVSFSAGELEQMAAIASRFSEGYLLSPYDRERYSLGPALNSR